MQYRGCASELGREHSLTTCVVDNSGRSTGRLHVGGSWRGRVVVGSTSSSWHNLSIKLCSSRSLDTNEGSDSTKYGLCEGCSPLGTGLSP